MEIDPVAIALAEDIGPGDVTAEFFVGADHQSRARIFAKEDCILAGVNTAAEVFLRLDSRLAVEIVRRDGDALRDGDAALEISGPTRAILSGERVALNFIQRLSGVATMTRRFVRAAGSEV